MRMEKVNALIKRELGNMILFGDIHDPRVSLVTIMSVDVSKDLQHAHVKFSVLKDDPKLIENAIEGLESSRGFIRKMIGQRLKLRYTPEFKFKFDKGVQYAAQIDMTLAEINKNIQQ
jgi:ribosome-binding factor A